MDCIRFLSLSDEIIRKMKYVVNSADISSVERDTANKIPVGNKQHNEHQTNKTPVGNKQRNEHLTNKTPVGNKHHN